MPLNKRSSGYKLGEKIGTYIGIFLVCVAVAFVAVGAWKLIEWLAGL